MKNGTDPTIGSDDEAHDKVTEAQAPIAMRQSRPTAIMDEDTSQLETAHAFAIQ